MTLWKSWTSPIVRLVFPLVTQTSCAAVSKCWCPYDIDTTHKALTLHGSYRRHEIQLWSFTDMGLFQEAPLHSFQALQRHSKLQNLRLCENPLGEAGATCGFVEERASSPPGSPSITFAWIEGYAGPLR